MKKLNTQFYAKDFIETAEGLIFAVVAHGTEQGKVLCFLRYVLEDSGWKKYPTMQANAFLKKNHPNFLHYSTVLDAHLHAIDRSRIVKHHQPRARLLQLMQLNQRDVVECDLFYLGRLFHQHGLDLQKSGITGSLLIGAHQPSSDIDWVCYGREIFQKTRAITRELIREGQLQALSDNDWHQSYDRRACALSFAEYVWHERRKYNKAVINGRKFDLNFIDTDASHIDKKYQKCGPITLRCTIIDDSRAFDYPAEFKIDHDDISAVVSFTATYTGQAVKGETVEVSGLLEQTEQGEKRIVVGSTREADGEYIKVIHG